MWRFRSLGWRLTLFYAGLLLILVTGLGLFIYLQLDHFLSDTSASRLNYQISPHLTSGRPRRDNNTNNNGDLLVRLNTQIQIDVASNTLYAVVYDAQGRLVTDTAPATDRLGGTVAPVKPTFSTGTPTADQFQQARQSVGRTDGYFYYAADLTGAPRGIVLIIPLTEGQVDNQSPGGPTRQNSTPSNQVLGFVVAAQPLTEADSTLDQLRLLLVLGLLGALLLSLLLGLPIARLGLRPLNRVTNTALLIAEGDLTRRVELKKTSDAAHQQDEISRLTLTFNQMLDQIEAAFAAQRQSEARIRQFVADASHELRTPLTTLGGSVDVLLMQARHDPAHVEKFLRTMRREIDRLSRLVINMLQLTRLDSNGAQAFHFEDLDLTALTEQVYDDFKASNDQAQLQFEGDLSLPLWVRGDPDRLRQVLTNLIDNALRYTSPDRSIKVQLSPAITPAQEWASLRVIDEGSGISPQHLPRIFDRFYRGDPARAKTDGSAGLGLAIVRAITEAHGGTVEVESTIGVGTNFTVLLPLVRPFMARPRVLTQAEN